MFKKVLVANRGEIALRVLRACREMGIKSVAVYSEADDGALHARYADEAYLIGPGPAAESYLDPSRILSAARASGAEAIHPGYGFLSERSEFASACADAGFVFIGPPPDAMRQLGDKVEARRIARAAGVPTVPGTAGIVEPAEAREVAKRIGYPLLIKAAAGGGGRGIRLVTDANALDAAIDVAASEARAAFGDAGLYVEKYLDPVRHVEVQVMADAHGSVVHLGERECSVQRRNQKLLEESPSPAVSPELREKLGAAAVNIARLAGYQNAGTVEFLLDPEGNYYFIEVNARLQVEHPVTELVTGIDLVKTQLAVAAGERLPFAQEDIRFNGWAMECRITAEDPLQGFMPNLGRIEYLSEPSGPGVRIDSGIYEGQEIAPFYDSMLSKAIAWGEDRRAAVARLLRALEEYVILGPRTTIPFHRALLSNQQFLDGKFDTRFLERHFDMTAIEAPGAENVALMAAAALLHKDRPPVPAAPVDTAWRNAGHFAALRRPIGGRSWRNTF